MLCCWNVWLSILEPRKFLWVQKSLRLLPGLIIVSGYFFALRTIKAAIAMDTAFESGWCWRMTIPARPVWKLGYDKLGSISGSTVYSLNPGCIILCPAATSTWKHETSIVHVSALGFLPWDDRKEHGAVIGKIGLYSSSTNTEGDYGTGAGAYSREVSGAGLLMGAGYVLPFAEHLSARAAADIFFKVKVTDPIQSGNTIPETLFKLALGVDFTF